MSAASLRTATIRPTTHKVTPSNPMRWKGMVGGVVRRVFNSREEAEQWRTTYNKRFRRGK